MYITYIGNFLSEHGTNPTYSESLVPEFSRHGLNVRWASRFMNPVARLLDMVFAVLRTPRSGACIIVDLYSGPRAFPAAYLVSSICRLTRKPYLVVLHGGRLPKLLAKAQPRLLTMLKGAVRVVSPSRYLAQAFAGHVDVEVI